MRALITGATGFVGGRLLDFVDQPVVLSRNVKRAKQKIPQAEVHAWDPMAGPPPREAFAGVEAIFHLAGDPVAEGRWTAEKKRRIRDSRVVGTANLVRGLKQLDQRPPALVAASAVGWYGSRGDEILDETAAPADDFLAEVCVAWEDAAGEARELGVRVVNTRFGIVLGHEGALAKMLVPFRLGLGGRLGHGHQYMPWVHVDDVVGIMLHSAHHAELSGAVNTVSPEPVTNREFTRVLAKLLHRPALFPAPVFGLKLLLGEFAEILVASQRVVPRAALNSGYKFRYPALEAALRAVLENSHQPVSAAAGHAVGAH